MNWGWQYLWKRNDSVGSSSNNHSDADPSFTLKNNWTSGEGRGSNWTHPPFSKMPCADVYGPRLSWTRPGITRHSKIRVPTVRSIDSSQGKTLQDHEFSPSSARRSKIRAGSVLYKGKTGLSESKIYGKNGLNHLNRIVLMSGRVEMKHHEWLLTSTCLFLGKPPLLIHLYNWWLMYIGVHARQTNRTCL